MEVPKEILNEIADNMEAGFKCYLHRDTFELVTFPDPDQHLDMESDVWKGEMSKVRKNKKQFIEIEQMMSSDGFRVMAEFVDSLPNNTIKIRLLTALEGQKPFANFKHQINNSGDYRELWFAFRRQKHIEWIQNEIRFEIHRAMRTTVSLSKCRLQNKCSAAYRYSASVRALESRMSFGI